MLKSVWNVNVYLRSVLPFLAGAAPVMSLTMVFVQDDKPNEAVCDHLATMHTNFCEVIAIEYERTFVDADLLSAK